MKKLFFVILLFISHFCACNWAQETLNRLTLEEKIGQLFIAATVIDAGGHDAVVKRIQSKIDPTPIQDIIQTYHIGGLLFLGKTTTPHEQQKFTRLCQNMSDIPLLITQDLEWGLDMRLRNVVKFPHNMTLGALQNDELIYEVGKEVGRQCRLLGVHINFAPVVDVNNNPENPVINDRSFGDDKERVARKAVFFMRGLQDAGVIACAKHFPGHGDTNMDSHLDLPKIEHALERLYNIELFPFKKIFDAGIQSVMIAHLEIPALEKKSHCPATLSHSIVTKLLQNELGFEGLIITDALNMEGVLKHNEPGQLELDALLAGNDILLCSKDIKRSIACIKQAIEDGLFPQEELDRRVLKILRAKEWIAQQEDLSQCSDINDQLHLPHVYDLKKQLYEGAITIVRDEQNILPLGLDETASYIQIGGTEANKFFEVLKKSIDVEKYRLSVEAHYENVEQLLLNLKRKNIVVVGLHGMNKYASKNYGISSPTMFLIDELIKQNMQIILVLFGSPYALQFFKNVSTVLVAYEDDRDAQIAAANVIVGSLQATGVLPVNSIYPN